MAHVRTLLLGLSVAAFAGPVPAAHAAERVETLEGELERILSLPALRHAYAGVHVRSVETGRTLFAKNSDRPFNPASNTKLLTSAAALSFLGPDYRFRTECRRDASLERRILRGNLYIKGYGDPTLTTKQAFQLANAIAMAGIEEVRGNVVIDSTFFDDVAEGPGWEQESRDKAYAAPIGALSIDHNTFEIHATPGGAPNTRVLVSTWPDVPSIHVHNGARTVRAGRSGELWIHTQRDDDGRSVRVSLWGTMPVDAEPRSRSARVHDPALFAGQSIARLLAMRGIRLRGRLVFGRMPEEGTVPVAVHRSEPLAEIVSELNKNSNNFIAEQILKTLAAERYGAPGTWKNGVRALYDFVEELGIDDDELVLGNGSGLNDVNRMTPAHITALLAAMYRRSDVQPEFVASLAVAGHSGTIRSRFSDSPAESKLRAKTGSLTGVSALSGYVETRDGEVLAFSVMMNDYRCGITKMRDIQDAIGIALAEHRRPEPLEAIEATEAIEVSQAIPELPRGVSASPSAPSAP